MFTHHAYYIEGSLSSFGEYKSALKPFWANTFERFGIDEARALISLAALKNFDTAVFLIGATSITSEAQQALLKLFEEPQQGTTFVLLLPHGVLLPTLKSRMQEFPQELGGQPSNATQAAAFIRASGKERSDYIAKMLKEDEGVRERVRDLVNALERELASRIAEPKVREALSDLAMVRGYLSDRSPSLKMLLEHLALSLPTV
jgi:DNA polymerase III delta prime subunit